MTPDLFDDAPQANVANKATNAAKNEALVPGAVLLRGIAANRAGSLLTAFDAITAQAPLRHLVTPGGHTMSVGMSNCGALGWVSDVNGYRYSPCDPTCNKPWPPIPVEWLALAANAAAQAGYAKFHPDACLINCYAPGAKMGLHQDRDEHDFAHPIVSVSLGLPAVFLFGGLKRSDKPRRLQLIDGDVVVWGGPARLAFHGVAPLPEGLHSVWGRRRVNLTFRCAG